MEMSGVTSSLTSALSTDQLGTVQSAVQLDVLKKANEAQAQQAAQLIQSATQQQPAPAQAGQPGAVINTYA